MDNRTEFIPGNIRMLIVDDDDDLRLTLTDCFESRGFVVASARNGSEAVELLDSRRERFEIVITDLVMPGCDGLDVLNAAKQSNPQTHVVVITGYSSIETAIESIRCGAFDYLAKPFKLVEIEILVNKILEHLHLLEENKRLASKLTVLSERSRSVDSRLESIESLLRRIVATLEERYQNVDTA